MAIARNLNNLYDNISEENESEVSVADDVRDEGTSNNSDVESVNGEEESSDSEMDDDSCDSMAGYIKKGEDFITLDVMIQMEYC
jgi:hypothetical protein